MIEEESIATAAPETLYAGEPAVIEKGTQHLQFKGRFILTSVKSGLMLIDQHRAHIRVLFDRYRAQIQQKRDSHKVFFSRKSCNFRLPMAAVLQSNHGQIYPRGL